jgi:protein phosphatase methylesterase 1
LPLLLLLLPLLLLLQAAAGDAASAGMLTWRTPLSVSRPHWEGWYRGLSDTFLALPVPKMLLLAGTDR